MPGTVTISKWGEALVTARYSSKNERNSILSFFNLLYTDLYEGKNYSVTVCPDDCTEAETVTQLSEAGCIYSYMRVGSLYDSGPDTVRPLASKAFLTSKI